ncbi:MAG: histidine phosphatase family protein [Candidatus Moranbacteria bacterium]|nr:histidine phosphatase family protein [Candidatus Moranbacteria bacterium]
MFENPIGIAEKQEQKEGPEARVFFIRHSKATYRSYGEKLKSTEPETPMDIESQSADLSSEGIELARKEAQRFFSEFDPGNDIVFIVSSNQMRAIETARIYADTALEMGIEVVHHEKTGTEIAAKVGDDMVRSIDTLSPKMENMVFGSVFNPKSQVPEINWEGTNSGTKELFEKARAIVLADDRGSWGANFYAHADAVKKIIPEVETPKHLHETQFKNMQRLAKFARSKATGEKRVNIIGFGHEDAMGEVLEEQTGDHNIGNVEAVEMTEDGRLERL